MPVNNALARHVAETGRAHHPAEELGPSKVTLLRKQLVIDRLGLLSMPGTIAPVLGSSVTEHR
jgi:hypothetical protein